MRTWTRSASSECPRCPEFSLTNRCVSISVERSGVPVIGQERDVDDAGGRLFGGAVAAGQHPGADPAR
jgi:hypothetical protein